MPVVINRSTGESGSGKKPDKPSAKPSKPAAAKAKGKKASGGGWADVDPKTKIIALSVVIVVSLVAVLWMTGVFGSGSSPNGPVANSGLASTSGGTAAAPGAVGSRGGTRGNPGGMLRQPGGPMDSGQETRKTGALPGGEGIE